MLFEVVEDLRKQIPFSHGFQLDSWQLLKGIIFGGLYENAQLKEASRMFSIIYRPFFEIALPGWFLSVFRINGNITGGRIAIQSVCSPQCEFSDKVTIYFAPNLGFWLPLKSKNISNFG